MSAGLVLWHAGERTLRSDWGARCRLGHAEANRAGMAGGGMRRVRSRPAAGYMDARVVAAVAVVKDNDIASKDNELASQDNELASQDNFIILACD